ncbi:hypothetical protein [Bartonella birtlesii]|uniref:hypothetical protein n=1 Tax=Bartonella birtlesii TaxID=111504 RepID=UPI00036B99BF|nr:hypothetical protein [Bartonella birtlesii]
MKTFGNRTTGIADMCVVCADLSAILRLFSLLAKLLPLQVMGDAGGDVKTISHA